MDNTNDIEVLRRALKRERLARKEAEALIEAKSIELYEKNKQLNDLNNALEKILIKRNQKIKEKNKQFLDLIENVSDIIFTISPDGFFTYVNPVLCRVTKFSEKELKGSHFTKLVRQDHKKQIIIHYLDQINSLKDVTNIEFPIINKLGELVWLNQTARIVLNDRNVVKELVVVSRDVTEIKKANELLKQSEEKYRGVIENLKLGILEVDNSDRIIKAYPKFCQLSGYTEEELIGKSPIELFLDRDSKKVMKEQNKNRIRGKSGVYEVGLKKKNGEIAWVIISGAPFYNSNGELAGTMGIHWDISERKKMESELLNAKLKAEELNKVKEIFMANMSHEIRTPLNGIIGMTELLKNTKIDSSQKQYIDSIYSSSENLLVLINDLLDISKIEFGKLNLELTNFNLFELINKNIELLKVKADNKSIKVISKLDGNIPPILIGDPIRLGQVFLNLYSNAIKFTEKGEIDITIDLIKTKKDVHKIRFSIKDDGIGIEESKMKLIFDNFSQAEESTTRLYGGTGLGLSISKKIVEIMGGELMVESELGKGSEFYFEVDFQSIDEKQTETSSEDIYEFITDFKNAKILVVEDNPVNRLLITTILKEWNCDVVNAENGEDAIKKCIDDDFQLIFMDLRMPVLNGCEATKILREEYHLKTPIIALTANAINNEGFDCVNMGMQGYISKPFKQISINKELKKYVNIKDTEVNLIDTSKLDKLGDEKFVNQMICLFIEEANKDIVKIENAIESCDAELISSIAHKMKPSINYLCSNSLYKDVQNIEDWLEEDSLMYVKVNEFLVKLKKVILDFQNFLS